MVAYGRPGKLLGFCMDWCEILIGSFRTDRVMRRRPDIKISVSIGLSCTKRPKLDEQTFGRPNTIMKSRTHISGVSCLIISHPNF